MPKLLRLDDFIDKSIDEVIKLYRIGYRLEGPVYGRQIPTMTGTASLTFIIETSDGPIGQAIVYVDGTYRGITDDDGILKVSDLSASNIGTNHPYIIIRQGFNGREGRILLFPNVNDVVSILLTDLTIGKGSVLVHANCLGSPCEGVHILMGDKDIGTTGSDGTVLLENLDIGYDIPFIARKDGYNDIHDLITIMDRFTLVSRQIVMKPYLPNSGVMNFLTIESDGTPTSDVQVSIDGSFVGKTDDSGQLTVKGLEDVPHSYIISKSGYTTITSKSEIIIDIRFVPIIMSKSTT